MLAADGTPLKLSLRRALRAQKLRALLLVAPLLLFVVITFVLPIARHAVPLGREPDRSRDAAADRRGARGLGHHIGRDAGRAGLRRAARRPRRRHRGQDPHPPRLAAQLRDLGHLLADAQVRPPGRGHGPEPALPRAVPRDRRGLGLAADLADDQALFRPYTDGYFLNAVDLQKTPDGIGAEARARAHLPALFLRTFAPQPRHHRSPACCSATRSPGCSRACRCARRTSC